MCFNFLLFFELIFKVTAFIFFFFKCKKAIKDKVNIHIYIVDWPIFIWGFSFNANELQGGGVGGIVYASPIDAMAQRHKLHCVCLQGNDVQYIYICFLNKYMTREREISIDTRDMQFRARSLQLFT